MELITAAEYQRLLQQYSVLEADVYGPKVLLHQDVMIVKIFHLRRLFSKSLLFPAGMRYANNARQLLARKIPTVEILRYGRCFKPFRDLVWYRYLEGETLRNLCTKVESRSECLVEHLGAFVANLHQRGVLFRSLHWNNILVRPDGRFALIDILDTRFQSHPLNMSQRRRNFSHLLCRHPHDLHLYQENKDVFWRGYTSQAQLTLQQQNQLKQLDLSLRK